MTTKKKSNIVKILENRRLSSQSNKRANSYILRKLVCQPRSKFTKVWEKHSKYPVAFEDGRLFFDNYRTSYSLNGLGLKPVQMFKLGSLPSSQRIEDAALCQFVLESIPLRNQAWRPSLLTVTQDNYLKRSDLDNGQVLEQVFLSSNYKFRHLSWNNLGHSIVVKSTQLKSPLNRTQLSRAGQNAPNVLLAFALFDVYPLRFVGMAEITRKIFGKDIIDAMITEGMLLVMHPNNLLKLYSWERILEKSFLHEATLGTQCSQLDGGIVGSRSAGLPLNISISCCPTVLFEVKCQHHSLVWGGIPWHYIMCPPGKQSQFHVYSLESNLLAKNGRLYMDSLSVEPDKCLFHEDGSGRVIHIGSSEVRIFRFRENGDQTTQSWSLHEDFSIDTQILRPKIVTPLENEISVTSSGRRVRRTNSHVNDSVQCDLESIQLVDYEDDMDLLIVTAVYQKEDHFLGTMYFHDNGTGEVLKEVTLDEPWVEFCTHNVTLDMDKIIHTVAGPNRKFSCYVHQLDLRPEEDTTERRSGMRKGKKSVNMLARTRTSRARHNRNHNAGFYNDDCDG